MNMKIYYDQFGEILVYNEEAFPKKREYQDNIENILVLENIVESLSAEYEDYKKQMLNLGKKRKQIKDKIKKHRKSRRWWLVIQLIIVPIITFFIFNMIGNFMTHSIFDMIASITFPEILIFLGIEGLLTICTLSFGHLHQDVKNYHLINELNDKINGCSIALMAAKKIIKKKELELEDLENVKNTVHKIENINQVKEIEYKEDLLKQKTFLMRMYRYGTNEDYYQKLIHHNDLFDKMYDRYEESGNTRKRSLNLENNVKK